MYKYNIIVMDRKLNSMEKKAWFRVKVKETTVVEKGAKPVKRKTDWFQGALTNN